MERATHLNHKMLSFLAFPLIICVVLGKSLLLWACFLFSNIGIMVSAISVILRIRWDNVQGSYTIKPSKNGGYCHHHQQRLTAPWRMCGFIVQWCRQGAGKASPVGHIQPMACFWTVYKLRMVFTFLKSLRKQNKTEATGAATPVAGAPGLPQTWNNSLPGPSQKVRWPPFYTERPRIRIAHQFAIDRWAQRFPNHVWNMEKILKSHGLGGQQIYVLKLNCGHKLC